MSAVTRLFLSSTRPTGALKFIRATFATQPGSKEHIESLIKDKKLVVFMKGTPDAPQCGFSNAVVQILRFHGVNEFDSYNVLQDENVRQGIKDYSNWPTIPQVYINGEFIGGTDIMIEMHKNGELIEELEKIGIRSDLLDNPDKQA
ncbi:glutaredoxin-related protein 5, mitochondrial-like [Lingula anatina]|uniref:Glutaredoxin-related protein 5, mitochondrial n=1 Tax=Lingula anatina TaxID=7574 RepID=A0A1S3HK33_LINAN|nr:glutaredoxin-related protein 5, mitochondrial-like [Lingula anatina]XP_013386494.1 glutaredoxin-related protein 5, mitochondrial-like [Lingula anatina]|eukprot:XP_013386478.1 glutaredoxin-related protein 5, mitochondrial-like [Lingula anatina]